MTTQSNAELVERLLRQLSEGGRLYLDTPGLGTRKLDKSEHDKIIAALSPPAAPVEGWKMVPVEPTQEMRLAIEKAAFGYPLAYERHYRAAISASPPPPNAGGLDPGTLEAAAKVAERVGNFGDLKREELTHDFGQPRFDMMKSIAAAIRAMGRNGAKEG